MMALMNIVALCNLVTLVTPGTLNFKFQILWFQAHVYGSRDSGRPFEATPIDGSIGGMIGTQMWNNKNDHYMKTDDDKYRCWLHCELSLTSYVCFISGYFQEHGH